MTARYIKAQLRGCGVAGLCAGAPPRATPPFNEERGGAHGRPGGHTEARKPATPQTDCQ